MALALLAGVGDASPDAPAAAVSEAPTLVSGPTITGTVVIGGTLQCASSWNGTPTPVVTYAWWRGMTSVDVGAIHVIGRDDNGASLVCRATAVNDAGTVSADSAATLVAYGLSITVAGPAQGTITVTSSVYGPELACSNVCSLLLAQGSVVTLTATPDPGARFEAWSGACVGSAECTVAMVSDQSVTGAFVEGPPVVSTRPSISGLAELGQTLTCAPGTWTSNLSVVTATRWLRAGNPILGETAATHQVVGDDNGQQLVCEVTATSSGGATSATSDPVSITYALALHIAGTGGGTVTAIAGSVAPQVCQATCVLLLPQGSAVTLHAEANTTSTFLGWDDAACPAMLDCSFDLTGARPIVATFQAAVVTLDGTRIAARWVLSRLTGRLVVSGTTTHAFRATVTLSGSTGPVLTADFDLAAGPYAVSVALPAGLRADTYRASIDGAIGTLAVHQGLTLGLPAAPFGLVGDGFLTKRRGGAATLSIAGTPRVLYAYFQFVRNPTRNRRYAVRCGARGATTVASVGRGWRRALAFRLTTPGGFRTGVWRCTLRAGHTALFVVTVAVGRA